MAIRGAKPKPTLRLVAEGTYDPSRHDRREGEPIPTGRPLKPKGLRGRAAQLWDEYLARGFWLTEADSAALGIFCNLTAETERNLKNMVPGRISNWRSLAGSLGFLPAERARLGTGGGKKSDDPAERHFRTKTTV